MPVLSTRCSTIIHRQMKPHYIHNNRKTQVYARGLSRGSFWETNPNSNNRRGLKMSCPDLLNRSNRLIVPSRWALFLACFPRAATLPPLKSFGGSHFLEAMNQRDRVFLRHQTSNRSSDNFQQVYHRFFVKSVEMTSHTDLHFVDPLLPSADLNSTFSSAWLSCRRP
jgi:hypothetical protein